MERIKALINILYQQAEQLADASTLMITVQQLQEELSRHAAISPDRLSTAKVAVMLPAGKYAYSTREKEPVKVPVQPAAPVKETLKESAKEIDVEPAKETAKEPVKEIKKQKEQIAEPVAAVPKDANGKEVLREAYKPARETAARTFSLPEAAGNRSVPAPAGASFSQGEPEHWAYDPVQEIPTLSHQREFKERNDVFGKNTTSLNDTLKTEKTDLAAALKEGPIKDLKKAIGVNDRFVFLGELFRGDEAMYERSIKTINNFRIYPEAEYWIERELKVKLGWDENKDAVKHFRQLVKRRFL